MPTREAEIVTYLRLDATLSALATGGIYSHGDLPESGITDAVGAPTVWTGGTFHPCAVVHERFAMPQQQVTDEPTQTVDVAQVIEVYAYGASQDTAHAILDRIYALVQFHRFTAAFQAQFWGGIPAMRAPELPSIWQIRNDYRIKSLRKAA
jgi:hypothetical protein